ncbi:YdcF family protein [Ectothiorhodospira lacustris]|uniref:YdcF family protein n=1 Tax=Ectothiorhodospira lacustris TaxID=2899127 RepID=UPI001EE8EC54|nr:YdcF family protein [Ectothiorhodospira lacustris]MCG5500878.1 YdcF family protein [Ectothiorhodospira lacustris]MCG5511388.1 YdcF family protein [Ectothiorhodospira lacustris]MCG5523211.1 YdcF family protein [Ectothiorhodospira lacustris]
MALELLLMPPASPLILVVTGLLFRRTWMGRGLVVLGLLLLYVASLPMVSHALTGALEERARAVEVAPAPARVIIILAGGRRVDAPEYGADTVNHFSLERARYGAWVHRQTGLPILVSGGRVGGDEPLSEAELMQQVLTEEWGVPVRWVEDRSRNTCENALFSAELLRAEGIEHAVLVTHAVHVPRARWCFEQTGLTVSAMPTYSRRPDQQAAAGFDGRGLIPQSAALERTRFALHEYLGMVWYRFRYR